jgi:hypothetical protein
VDILNSLVEIINRNTSTKTSSNLASFDKINKSEDRGCSGDIFHTLSTYTEKSPHENIMTLMITHHLMI